MAVSGVARPNFEAINRVLAEIGKSLGEDSQQGVRVSDAEAQKIVDHLGKMQPADRKLVEAEIIALLQNDVFQTTPEGLKKFAETFGVTARDLEPRETASLVGLASSKSAFQMGVETLAKTPRLDRKTMKLLTTRADTLLDMPGRQFLAGVIRNASRDGTVKLDTDARKLFREWMGGLDQNGGVSDWTTSFDKKGAGNIDYLSQLIASGACFEDIVAAFLFHIIGQAQEEQMEKMREIAALDKSEQKEAVQVKKRMNAFMQENLGLDDAKPGAADAGKTAEAGASVAAGATAPDAEYAKNTKKNLEALVQSVHHHLNDDDKYINADEAGKIAEKLQRLEPPVSKLIAGALVSSLRHTPGVYLESDTFKPIVEWAKGQLGQDIDLSPVRPPPGSPEPTDAFAKELRKSDKLEDKIASFMVDSLLAGEKDLGSKLAEVKRLSETMGQFPEAAKAYEQVTAQQSAALSPEASLSDPVAAAGASPRAAQAAEAAQPDAAAAALARAAAGEPALAQAAGEAGGAEPKKVKSRQELFEDLKNLNNELSALMQALSNILNSMHQNAMNSVRAIR